MKNFFLAATWLLSATFCQAQQTSMFPELRYFRPYYGTHAIDKNQVAADTNLIGIWKLQEDTDPHNYFVLQRFDHHSFVFTYMNRGGSNRTYENVSMHLSKIGNTNYINISFFDIENDKTGYCYLKVSDLTNWSMTLSLVTDEDLKKLGSSAAISDAISRNSNNAKYFGKPMHFRKILPLMYCK